VAGLPPATNQAQPLIWRPPVRGFRPRSEMLILKVPGPPHCPARSRCKTHMSQMTGPTEYRGAYIVACLLLASLAPGAAQPVPVILYAPGENLERIDVALIDRAEHEIDMAAYVLTDWPILQALTPAADRGVLAAGSIPSQTITSPAQVRAGE
jgi:phosphatidylserine/phosphatidylglycerophosphate/cardiolipin synthase-like enzyme